MRRKITKSTIDSAKPSDTTYIIFDTELAGYDLKVTPTGKKVFIYQYRLRGSSKSQRITIGRYLDFVENYCERQKLTAHSAREIAEILRGKVKSGKDPKLKKHRDDQNFLRTSDLLDQFIRDYIEVKFKPSTQYGYKGYIKNVIKPEFGNNPVNEITKADIARLHQKNTNQPCRANHIYSTLSKFFNWCEDLGYISEGTNPCNKVKKYSIKGKECFLSSIENAALDVVLENALSNKSETIFTISAIQLLRFTGARRNGILGLRWEWVDLEKSIINLPDSKTGQKAILLNSAAKNVLRVIPRVANNPFVIFGRRENKHLVNIQKPWRWTCFTKVESA